MKQERDKFEKMLAEVTCERDRFEKMLLEVTCERDNQRKALDEADALNKKL